MRFAPLLVLALVASAAACKTRREPKPRPREPVAAGSAEPAAGSAEPAAGAGSGSAAASEPRYGALPRAELNRWAVRQNLPLYWIADANDNQQVDPDEVAPLLFYPTDGAWVAGGKFTPAFDAAYQQIAAAAKAGPPADPREKLVGDDLDQGRATLVRSDLTAVSAEEKAFARAMLGVATLIDNLYELMNGATALRARLPEDAASHSLFRRNRGPRCVGPRTEKNKACSAIPGAPKPVFDLYPAALQADDKFCAALAKRPDAKPLLESHFGVVRGSGANWKAVEYTEAYRDQMTAIATALTAAADLVKDPAEAALVAYLRAAAASFLSNDWRPADEAWAKMNADNSKWYVRVAPDEVYWEPCARKAGFHLTFARINQRSKEWQQKLVPVRQEMEQRIAQRAGAPYAARKVAFQLPDFIDIVVNAGDDRTALGATIGQSLPNWGPVANEGRGRTVAMTNLYQDPDSIAARRAQAESILDTASLRAYSGESEPGLLGTILHEATHNLGPAHEYKVAGKTAGAIFGGQEASVMEELKAQTGALSLIEMLRGKKLISGELAAQSYADAIVWALGHISQGMYAGAGERKTYSNLAAIQIGFLLEKGALTWNPRAKAANGKDTGALTIHYGKLVPVIDEMMKLVGGIKARGDRAAAVALLAKYVDGTVVPHAAIKDRFLREPKASFVYSVAL